MKTCIFCSRVQSSHWHKNNAVCHACYEKNRIKTKPYLLLNCIQCGPKKVKKLINGICEKCYFSGLDQSKYKVIKTCAQCQERKQSAFIKTVCRRCYTSNHRNNNPGIYKKSREKNREKILKYSKNYSLKNPEKRAAREAARRIKTNHGAASFSDVTNIRVFYEKRPLNMEVDHIIPIKNKNICGLHVSWNLQYLTPKENRTKNNKFDGTSSNEGWRT